MTAADEAEHAPLVEWLEAHRDLIGEGGAIENVLRLLDHAYNPDGCDDPRFLSAHTPTLVRAKPGRTSDAIADLADALVGLRGVFERLEAQQEASDQEDVDRRAKTSAVEWQQSLDDVRGNLRGIVHMARNLGINFADDATLVGYFIAELDRRLRAGTGLRYTFAALGREPQGDLRAEAAEEFGRARVANPPPDEALPADKALRVIEEAFIAGYVRASGGE